MTSSNSLNSFPYGDHIKELEDALTNELSKTIDEDIILNILSPETKGQPPSERWKVIKRNQKIDQVIGVDDSFIVETEDGDIIIDNFLEGTVDVQKHFEKKTFKLITDFTKPGYVWAPWVPVMSVPVIHVSQFTPKSSIGSKYANIYIDPKFYK
jgi:hypothetical protein